MRKEIQLGTTSIFWMSFPTVALFFWEVRGHSRLYDSVSESSLGEMFKNAGQGSCSLPSFESGSYEKMISNSLFPLSGWPGMFLSIAAFLFFTDMCIYWIHRFMHHKNIYKVGVSMFMASKKLL